MSELLPNFGEQKKALENAARILIGNIKAEASDDNDVDAAKDANSILADAKELERLMNETTDIKAWLGSEGIQKEYDKLLGEYERLQKAREEKE